MGKSTKLRMSEYSYNVQQHEDAVLKTSMQFFADELLPYLDIKGKVGRRNLETF